MTTVLNPAPAQSAETPVPRTNEIRLALLGLGNVGGALAELVSGPPAGTERFRIVSALVRDTRRRRPVDTSAIPLTTDPRAALGARPDVVVEVLGGVEPARTIVLAALSQGLPVVTANKSLLAMHGDELFAAAAAHGTPLLYEASVLAGVPFLGTFRRRPRARDVTAIAGIVNGTSNYILSRMLTERAPFADALGEAQRAGYAEPDPAKDINGDDAAEKLCVLLRHFGGWNCAPGTIAQQGIAEVELEDLRHAVAFGGRIRPVAVAEWTSDTVSAFVGPAFVPESNTLASVEGVQNAVSLRSRWSGTLFFSGPGAGPAVTAATVLDDVVEAREMTGSTRPIGPSRTPAPGAPATGWFLRVTSSQLRDEQDAPSVLATLGVRLRRHSRLLTRDGRQRQWLLIQPCTPDHIAAALAVLAGKYQCVIARMRALE